MHKNQAHEWHENRPKEEGGGKRYWRARWDTREWRFSLLEPEFEDWQRLEQPSVEDYQALREVLWRKYQRRRVPFKFLEGVDRILTDLGVEPAPSEEE